MSIEEIIKSIPTRHVKNGRVVHRRADEFQEEVLTKLADRAASAAGDVDIAALVHWLTLLHGKLSRHNERYEFWSEEICGIENWIKKLQASRDTTLTEKPRSDKGKHHHVAGVLQEDVDEAEN